MSKLSKKTVALLNKLKKYITNNPEVFNLGAWGSIVDPKSYGEYTHLEPEDKEPERAVVVQQPACGAVGCIAGNICIMTGAIKPIHHFDGFEVYEMGWETPKLAERKLGITRYQANRLFYLGSWRVAVALDEEGEFTGWPEEFEKRLKKFEPGTLGYVAVTCDRIDHFIKTQGEE